MGDILDEEYGKESLALNFVEMNADDLLHGSTQDSVFEFDNQFTLPSQGLCESVPELNEEAYAQEMTFIEERYEQPDHQLPAHACRSKPCYSLVMQTEKKVTDLELVHLIRIGMEQRVGKQLHRGPSSAAEL
ncbi:hypothetical protein Tcan_03928 [Toxocara canis]|uniref:Uncharacterized protein n=1 Tax=Toxocara canis TaxID=6265 RepID=A0A0B2VVE1_TOXCA|nr:hypothetical protein Tcan_03928 [Toxocara canis]